VKALVSTRAGEEAQRLVVSVGGDGDELGAVVDCRGGEAAAFGRESIGWRVCAALVKSCMEELESALEGGAVWAVRRFRSR